jgi:hypothetical protein
MKRLLLLVSAFVTGCYSETIGPYVTEVVPSKDRTQYLVQRCYITLDHGLFGSSTLTRGNCETEKLHPLPASSATTGKP